MSIRSKYLAAVGAAIGLLLSSQQVTAQNCNPCPSPCGTWEIGAHALYFTPITCPYAYATVFASLSGGGGVTNANGQAQLIPCRADWGFRIFGNYLNDCIFAALSYQCFEVTTSRTIASDILLRIQGGSTLGPGQATGQVGIEYQNVDIRLGKYLLRGCGSALYLYGNARWVDLSHRRTARAAFTGAFTNGFADDVREKSQLQGGALGIGFGGEFDIWCDVGGFIDGNVLGVIGERSIKDVRFRRSAPGLFDQERESYPSETCVIPEVDFRIGINYTYVCGCWKLVGEIGYELDYFWQASVLPDLTSSLTAAGNRDFVLVCEDLGFSGLFFGGRLIF